MFTTLPETRAPRARRLGGTLTSLLVHGVLVASAATAVSRTRDAGAHAVDHQPPVIFHVPVPRHPTTASPDPIPARAASSDDAPLPTRRIVIDNLVPPGIPPIDPGTPPVVDERLSIGRGGLPGIPAGPYAGGGALGGAGGVIGEHEADRAPHVVGAAVTPHYPDALRAAGITGRVVVQFVVDTLGRFEPASLEVLDAARPAFADAVRDVLPRYRFSPGEAGGRRVRTRVQLPFDFTLR